MHIILLSIVNDSDINLYIFCLFLDCKQTNYFKIGEFCLFMMYKLNVKWSVTKTEGQRRLQLSFF